MYATPTSNDGGMLINSSSMFNLAASCGPSSTSSSGKPTTNSDSNSNSSASSATLLGPQQPILLHMPSYVSAASRQQPLTSARGALPHITNGLSCLPGTRWTPAGAGADREPSGMTAAAGTGIGGGGGGGMTSLYGKLRTAAVSTQAAAFDPAVLHANPAAQQQDIMPKTRFTTTTTASASAGAAQHHKPASLGAAATARGAATTTSCASAPLLQYSLFSNSSHSSSISSHHSNSSSSRSSALSTHSTISTLHTATATAAATDQGLGLPQSHNILGSTPAAALPSSNIPVAAIDAAPAQEPLSAFGMGAATAAAAQRDCFSEHDASLLSLLLSLRGTAVGTGMAAPHSSSTHGVDPLAAAAAVAAQSWLDPTAASPPIDLSFLDQLQELQVTNQLAMGSSSNNNNTGNSSGISAAHLPAASAELLQRNLLVEQHTHLQQQPYASAVSTSTVDTTLSQPQQGSLSSGALPPAGIPGPLTFQALLAAGQYTMGLAEPAMQASAVPRPPSLALAAGSSLADTDAQAGASTLTAHQLQQATTPAHFAHSEQLALAQLLAQLARDSSQVNSNGIVSGSTHSTNSTQSINRTNNPITVAPHGLSAAAAGTADHSVSAALAALKSKLVLGGSLPAGFATASSTSMLAGVPELCSAAGRAASAVGSLPVSVSVPAGPGGSRQAAGPPGPGNNPLYKTELCRTWLETGGCRYGCRCQFAHGAQELRPLQRHPKYKTQPCRTYALQGHCPYGDRCNFIHDLQLQPFPTAHEDSSGRLGAATPEQ